MSHPSINTFENLRQIHFAIQNKYICQFEGDHESTGGRVGGALPAEALLGLQQHEQEAPTQLFRALLPRRWESRGGGAVGRGRGRLLQTPGNDCED